ncbi:MAG: hypothetical protein EZS28_027746 [Streblomastix strix]|uniref:protein-tyrosine-phosphatase n=1 Tax=Streblomastix strix TaxID=222440 RepID=A0A5J4V1Z8_9EUKA|nr:MAG: hypothetical protein EZS28_027746 [Streblomastix strix]
MFVACIYTFQQVIDYLTGSRSNAPFTIIDTRWPYEYVGGHIVTALNIYTQEAVQKHFFEPLLNLHNHLLIFFHCEFSTRRG